MNWSGLGAFMSWKLFMYHLESPHTPLVVCLQQCEKQWHKNVITQVMTMLVLQNGFLIFENLSSRFL